MADSYDLTIILNGADITTLCPFDKLGHDDNHRSPSYFKLTVENPTITPEQGMQLIVIAKSMAGAPTIFSGYVLEMTIRKRDNAITLEYDLDCGDMKALMAKTVLPYKEYAGSDADIIQELLADTYPDLSDLLDFESGVNSFADDLSFTSNDESLLDALNRFADQTGANLRLETGTGSGNIRLSFTPNSDVIVQGVSGTGGATPYWYFFGTSDFTESHASTGGLPGYCIRMAKGSYSPSSTERGQLVINLASAAEVSNIKFDAKVTGGSPNGQWNVSAGFGASGNDNATDADIAIDAWTHFDCAALNPSAFPYTATATGSEYRLHIKIEFGCLTSKSNLIAFLDNVVIEASVPLQDGGLDKLDWDAFPDFSDFDFDIANSPEFGSDFDLNLGAIDDFNSITVIGGKALVAVDEALEWDGSSVYMKLPFKVRSLAVYKNTGSDTTPSWTAQTVGIDGTDEISAKDVLHNPTESFLYFATNPANMNKAVRITGFREKPIRVRVEDIGEGDRTYATVVTNESITSEEDAIAYANSLLAKKNAPRRLEFQTYNEGLKVGQEVSVTDSARGLAESLIIRRISTKWLSTNTAEFSVECGEDEASSLDNIIVGIDKKTNQNVGNGAFGTITINKLVDDDDEQLFDEDGALLYEVDGDE